MITRSVVKGVGHYLPERVVENAEFEKTLDTTDEWIRSRSGIERRHIAAEGETTSMLAIKAAQAALADAGMAPEDIDAIVVATSTPDLTFPSVATMVQAGIGAHNAFGYDVQAVCAGFVFALANAGVSLAGVDLGTQAPQWVMMAVAVALVLGKPLGIVSVSWLMVRLGWCALPAGVNWSSITLIGLLAGIGFTMSIFIANLAFVDPATLGAAKLGVLLASVIAAALGLAWGAWRVRRA